MTNSVSYIDLFNSSRKPSTLPSYLTLHRLDCICNSLKNYSIVESSYLTTLQKSKFFGLGNRRTWGHSLKLSKQKFNCDERNFLFSNRIVDSWNIFPEEAINATSVENFRQYLNQNSDLSKFLHGGFL